MREEREEPEQQLASGWPVQEGGVPPPSLSVHSSWPLRIKPDKCTEAGRDPTCSPFFSPSEKPLSHLRGALSSSFPFIKSSPRKDLSDSHAVPPGGAALQQGRTEGPPWGAEVVSWGGRRRVWVGTMGKAGFPSPRLAATRPWLCWPVGVGAPPCPRLPDQALALGSQGVWTSPAQLRLGGDGARGQVGSRACRSSAPGGAGTGSAQEGAAAYKNQGIGEPRTLPSAP